MSNVSVANLTWRPAPSHRHYMLAWVVVSPTRRLKIAGLYNENANPRKPPGTPELARPFTLELYIPVPPGVDRVMKFTDEQDARAAASKQLASFIADTTEIF